MCGHDRSGNVNCKGGDTLVINGLNFGLTPTVLVGGVPCQVQQPTTHNQVKCTVPPGQGGSLDVKVRPSMVRPWKGASLLLRTDHCGRSVCHSRGRVFLQHSFHHGVDGASLFMACSLWAPNLVHSPSMFRCQSRQASILHSYRQPVAT